MPLDTSVKRIHESMRGAPQLKGAAGTGVAVLDAFLVDGWGLATATSGSVSAGVCTLNMGVGNDFEEHCVVLVAGATPAAVNGEHRLTQGGETIKFEVPGAADGPVTGTVTVKYASCGWEKVYTDTNKRVYRSQDVTGNRRYLRINDTGAAYMRVYGYNTMTAIETGTGNFGNALYWHKADAAGSTPMRYDCFGDSMALFYGPSPNYVAAGATEAYQNASLWFFGDQNYIKTGGDAWGTLITGETTSSSTGQYGTIGAETAGNGCYLERVAAGTGGAVQTIIDSVAGSAAASGNMASFDGSFGAFPDDISGRLRLTQTYTSDNAANPQKKRAVVPGHFWAMHSDLSTYSGAAARDTFPGPGDMSGRRLMYLPLGAYTRIAVVLMDITGPWR